LLVNQSALPKSRLFSNSISEDSVPQISSQEMENAGKKFHPVASASSAVAVIFFLNYYFALKFNYFLFKTRYRTVTLRPQYLSVSFHPVASASSTIAVIFSLHYHFSLQFNYFFFKTRYWTVTIRPQRLQHRITQLLVHLRLSQ
jgi:hypothetical protein